MIQLSCQRNVLLVSDLALAWLESQDDAWNSSPKKANGTRRINQKAPSVLGQRLSSESLYQRVSLLGSSRRGQGMKPGWGLGQLIPMIPRLLFPGLSLTQDVYNTRSQLVSLSSLCKIASSNIPVLFVKRTKSKPLVSRPLL